MMDAKGEGKGAKGGGDAWAAKGTGKQAKGGGKGKMLEALAAELMGKGGYGGYGGSSGSCKWCAQGECWDHWSSG